MHFSNGLIIMLLAFVVWVEKLHNLTGEKKYEALLAVLLLLGVALSPGNGIAAEKSLSIEDVTNNQGVKGLRATFQLSASREAIWDLLTDYDRFRETFTRIHSLEVLNEDDRGARVHFKVKVLFLTFEYTLQRDYERPYEFLTWHRTAGDFRQVSGSWEILPGPGEGIHVVVFESFVDVGYLIPTTTVRDQAAKELETTVTQIRARLEGGLIRGFPDKSRWGRPER